MARGASGELVSKGYQLRYTQAIKEALNQSEGFALSGYMQKEASTNKDYSIFYKFGSLSATETGNAYDGASGTFGVVDGFNANELLESIKVTPSYMYCPVWIHNEEFEKSTLDVKSPIVSAQMSAIYKHSNERVLTKVKTLLDGTYNRPNGDGTTTALTLDATHVLGDNTKFFEADDAISHELRKMVALAKVKANGRKIALVCGTQVYADLLSSTKFTNADWTNHKGNDTGKVNPNLLGCELIPLREFDTVFNSATQSDIVLIIEGGVGWSSRGDKIKGVVEEVKHRRAVFMDVQIPNSCEIIDEEHFMVFSYKKTGTV